MNRARAAVAALLVLVCHGLGGRADAQCSLYPLGGYVGIFGDLAGTETTIIFSDPPHPDTLYVLAFLDGATVDGFTGVQFRIEVTEPDGWFLSAHFTAEGQFSNVFDLEPANPNNTAGVAMGWSSCQAGPSPVLIGTIVAFTATGQTTDLLVKRKVPATNPGAPCARFDRCDPPQFSRAPMPAHEVDSLGEEIVSRARLFRDVVVPVSTGTWGAVKRLYRND